MLNRYPRNKNNGKSGFQTLISFISSQEIPVVIHPGIRIGEINHAVKAGIPVFMRAGSGIVTAVDPPHPMEDLSGTPGEGVIMTEQQSICLTGDDFSQLFPVL